MGILGKYQLRRIKVTRGRAVKNIRKNWKLGVLQKEENHDIRRYITTNPEERGIFKKLYFINKQKGKLLNEEISGVT